MYSKKKKILIYTPYYFPEPFPINSFIDELSTRDDVQKITIITCLPNYRRYNFYSGYNIFGPYREKKNKIDIIRLPVIPRLSNSKLSIFSFYLSFCIVTSIFLLLFSIIKRNKYDHTMTFCGSPVFIGYLGYFASIIINSRSSQWVQDIWPEAIETTVGMKNKTLRKIILNCQNFMWKLGDILFSESDSLTNYLKDQYPNKKVVTLYNPIRSEKYSENNSKIKINEKTNFSYIGNIGGAQNIELMIESFNAANLNNSVLNICGDGSLFRKLSSKYKENNIKWHGWITGNELEKIYSDSDFFILSLNSVGRQALIIPSKVQSYLMKKKPIICISLGAASELIQSINAGFCCKNISQEDIIKTYNSAYNSKVDEREAMGVNAFKFYEENFLKEKIVDKFLKYL